MPDDNPAAGPAAQVLPEQNRSLSLFRRPEKYKIGDDFDLFVKKSNLYFEAVELKDENKQRLALLFNPGADWPVGLPGDRPVGPPKIMNFFFHFAIKW